MGDALRNRVREVGDIDQGDSLTGANGIHEADESLTVFRIKVLTRFIENHERWVFDEGAREEGETLFATGEVSERFIGATTEFQLGQQSHGGGLLRF